MTYDEIPTRLDMAVSLFSRRGTSEGVGSVHARSVRIPTIENATIEAIAQHSGHSVNKVICELLAVALDEVTRSLPQEDWEEISAIRSKLITSLVEQGQLEGLPQAEKGEI